MGSPIIAPYTNNEIKILSFAIDKNKIPTNGDIWKMKIQFDHVKIFDFANADKDTIICLPKVLGDKVDVINYTITINGFDESVQFYCNLNKCAINNGEYIVQKQDIIQEGNFFKATMYPDNNGECAYYFNIGTLNQI